jgi:predicted pyridoxine 5'-phosphate oxidase superfamily flavin-nucleotide-binding protein
MTHRFAELMFTPRVMQVQAEQGSRAAYARFAEPSAPANDRLTDQEADFIAARDSFYMATVSETGWPYVQHRGGPAGFLKVIDDRTIGFPDYRGNRQYLSVGNLIANDRVSLLLMDYPNRRRLKLIGRARAVVAGPEAMVERGIVITLEGFDWNCPQHITPRYSEAEIRDMLGPPQARMRALEDENKILRARLTS